MCLQKLPQQKKDQRKILILVPRKQKIEKDTMRFILPISSRNPHAYFGSASFRQSRADLSNAISTRAVFLHSQRKRLHTTQRKITIERRRHATHRYHTRTHADRMRQKEIAEILCTKEKETRTGGVGEERKK
jgi:hypothetical protein